MQAFGFFEIFAPHVKASRTALLFISESGQIAALISSSILPGDLAMDRTKPKRIRSSLSIERLEPRCVLASAPEFLFVLDGGVSETREWMESSPPFSIKELIGEEGSTWEYQHAHFGFANVESRATASNGTFSGNWHSTLEWDTEPNRGRSVGQYADLMVYVRGPQGTPYEIDWREEGFVKATANGAHGYWEGIRKTEIWLEGPASALEPFGYTTGWSGRSGFEAQFADFPGQTYSFVARQPSRFALGQFQGLGQQQHVSIELQANVHIAADIAGEEPVAIIDTTPQSVAIGTAIAIDGLRSYDPDNESFAGAGIATWRWKITLPDGTEYNEGRPSFTYVPHLPGEYSVLLEVVDDEGESSRHEQVEFYAALPDLAIALATLDSDPLSNPMTNLIAFANGTVGSLLETKVTTLIDNIGPAPAGSTSLTAYATFGPQTSRTFTKAVPPLGPGNREIDASWSIPHPVSYTEFDSLDGVTVPSDLILHLYVDQTNSIPESDDGQRDELQNNHYTLNLCDDVVPIESTLKALASAWRSPIPQLTWAPDLLDHFLTGGGAAYMKSSTSTTALQLALTAEFQSRIVSPLQKLIESQLRSGFVPSGGTMIAKGVFQTPKFSTPLDAYLAMDGARSVTGTLDSVELTTSPSSLHYLATATVQIHDRYAFDVHDAKTLPFAGAARLLELCGAAHPFDSGIEVSFTIAGDIPHAPSLRYSTAPAGDSSESGVQSGLLEDGIWTFGAETGGRPQSALIVENDSTTSTTVFSATLSGGPFRFVGDLSLPRTLAPGDQLSLTVELVDTQVAGDVSLRIDSDAFTSPLTLIRISNPDNSPPRLLTSAVRSSDLRDSQIQLLADDDEGALRGQLQFEMMTQSDEVMLKDDGTLVWLPQADPLENYTINALIRVSDFGFPSLVSERTIQLVHDWPIARDDELGIWHGDDNATSILENDSDWNQAVMPDAVEVITSPTHGRVLNDNGVIRYVPHTNYYGKDSFVYRLINENGLVSRAATVKVMVANQQQPFFNRARPLDVDADDIVAPLDALLIINSLNALGPRGLSALSATDFDAFVDVNGDDWITPLDALLVINQLNAVGNADSEAAVSQEQSRRNYGLLAYLSLLDESRRSRRTELTVA